MYHSGETGNMYPLCVFRIDGHTFITALIAVRGSGQSVGAAL